MNPDPDTMSSAETTTTGEQGGHLGDTVREARSAAGEQLDAAKEAARSALGDAREAAVEKTAEVKDAAAGEISRTARGLEAAADELEGSPIQQELLREAASGLEQISRSMQGKSLGTMIEDLSDFGRRNPLAYIAGAALAGFALARFARASAPEGGATSSDVGRSTGEPVPSWDAPRPVGAAGQWEEPTHG